MPTTSMSDDAGTEPAAAEPDARPAVLLDLQRGPLEPADAARLPAAGELRDWAAAALAEADPRRETAEVTLRVVGRDEGAALNHRYRGSDGPTNVLSFPFQPPPGLPAEDAAGLLGDLVICAPVVGCEAAEQGKADPAHWAHLVVHGVLHLLGFDHLDEPEAAAMEALEVRILQRLGFPNPYQVCSDDPDDQRSSR